MRGRLLTARRYKTPKPAFVVLKTATMTSIASSETGPLTVEPLSERNVSRIPLILPHERVFPIQIGSELFKLSGASLSSDGKNKALIFFATMRHVAKPI